MPPSHSRKRSNAFEDFPVEPEVADAPVETVSPLVRRTPQAEEPQVERIERLRPSQMLPDRFQPRRLLTLAAKSIVTKPPANGWNWRKAILAPGRKLTGCCKWVLPLKITVRSNRLPAAGCLRAMGNSFSKSKQVNAASGQPVCRRSCIKPARNRCYGLRWLIIPPGSARCWKTAMPSRHQRWSRPAKWLP